MTAKVMVCLNNIREYNTEYSMWADNNRFQMMVKQLKMNTNNKTACLRTYTSKPSCIWLFPY